VSQQGATVQIIIGTLCTSHVPRGARRQGANSDYEIVPISEKARKNTWYELIEDVPHCFASRHERADAVEAAAPAPADFCIVRSKYA